MGGEDFVENLAENLVENLAENPAENLVAQSKAPKTENWCRPLWKIGKMALAPQKRVLEQNCQLLTPLKFGSTVFQVSSEMENWCWPLWKIGKMALAPQKTRPRAKLPITNPPKVWVYGFSSVIGN